MNKLIITAHPNPNGFAHTVAHEFKNVSEEQGHEVRTLSLYDAAHRQDYLILDEKNQPAHDPLQQTMQSHITWADELIFAYPMRWFDVPAILKNWFDVNFASWFAFEFVSGKAQAKPLLKWKKARVFVTTGWPAWFYNTLWKPLELLLTMGRFKYVGIWLRSYTIFGDMGNYKTEESRESMRAKVRKIAAQ